LWDNFLELKLKVIFNLAKRLTEKQKEEIKNNFLDNLSVEFLSEKFNCTKTTIIRNLKKSLGELKYKEILYSLNATFDTKDQKSLENYNQQNNEINNINRLDNTSISIGRSNEDKINPFESFIEITPLDHDFEDVSQKDISSIPLSEIKLPNVVFLIVKKEIELETKYLKDYPEWQFLPQNDLKRKTIEVHFDLKTAKRICNKDQKVIKVPNTDVFRIVAPILISHGISRLVTAENLISI
tara:strand:- start:172 stop:891 length:720 start_codon:yes stop_codon:yes gene_type:complete